ncbi:MAG: lipopolysaccharide biosynthesis protein [Pirellulaceae bacterium]|nr:lipopolysaccharide biosynthesis protein [Planctomycetales bacterium]
MDIFLAAHRESPGPSRGPWRVLGSRLWQALFGDSLLAKGGWSLLDQAIVSGTTLVTAALIGRTSGKFGMGIYVLAWSLVHFIRGVQEQVIFAPYMVYCSHRTGTRARWYAGSSLVHLTAFIAVAALALSIVAVVSWKWEAAFAELAWLLPVVIPPMMLREFGRQYFFAHLQAAAATLLDGLVAAIQLSALAMLWSCDGLNVNRVFAAMGIASLVGSGSWLLLRRRAFQPRRRHAVVAWWHNWTFAKWALLSHLVGTTIPLLMPWILQLVHGEVVTGGFGAATTVVGLASMMIMGLSRYIAPKAVHAFARFGWPGLRTFLVKAGALYLLVSGGFLVVASFGGEALVGIIVSDSGGSGTTMVFLAAALMATSIGMIAGNGLWAVDRPGDNFVADCVGVIVTLAATVVLVPSWSAVGAAAAMFGGSFSATVTRLFVLRRVVLKLPAMEVSAGGVG